MARKARAIRAILYLPSSILAPFRPYDSTMSLPQSRIVLVSEGSDPVPLQWLRTQAQVIEASPVKADISDLHVWRVGKGKYACILSLVTADDVEPDYFKRQLSIHEELVHISVEVNRHRLPA